MSESGLRGLKDLQDDVVGRVGGIDRIRIDGISRMMRAASEAVILRILESCKS